MKKETILVMSFLVLSGMIISGAIGYNYRSSEESERTKMMQSYTSQERVCAYTMHKLAEINRKNTTPMSTKETKKLAAIERMQRNY
jgi:hypothetical protein